MSVRAKMRVTKVTSYEAPAGAKEVHFAAVFGNTDPNDVNKKWSMWTPSGELRLHINNPEAAKQFEPGMFFFVDLHPTTKDA